MSTAIAQPLKALSLFSAITDRRLTSVPMNSEVSSREAMDSVHAAHEAKDRWRSSFLTVLLRSLGAFTA
jgi:hypothetical protein